MNSRKVILIIVEGSSDKTALGSLFYKIFKSNEVEIDVIHGDITSDFSYKPNNIMDFLAEEVQIHANVYKLMPNDYLKVIHIMDTDGTFIPNDRIIYDKNATKPFYSLENIYTNKPDSIKLRNQLKASIMEKLSTETRVWKNIPYIPCYMSSNLDHVLYNKLNTNNDEKENNTYLFAKQYRNNIAGFLKFITNSDFSVCKDLPSSWIFIRENINSLNRYTNLGLIFDNDSV